jgi:hypothetical protein
MAEDYLVADPAAKPDFPRRGVTAPALIDNPFGCGWE